MKSFLMVGAFPNFFNSSFIDNFKKLNLFSSYDCVVTSGSPDVSCDHKAFDSYIDLSFSPVNVKSRSVRRVCIFLYVAYKNLCFLFTLKKYDVILIQSLSFYHVIFFPLFRIKSKKLYATFWGCDFNAASPLKKTVMKFLLRYADGISTTSESMRLKIIKELSLKEQNTYITRFGLPTADFLSSVSIEQQLDFKTEYGIGEGVVVMCAPSGEPLRQIHEIIDCIKKLPEEVSRKAVFVFHMGYGCSDYKEKVIIKLSKITNIKYVVIDEFLVPERVAILRNITDVYINVAVRDQLSGAMMESIFCNNIILIGSWLNYIELSDRDVDFVKVSSVDPERLTEKMIKCIGMADEKKFPINKDKIKDLFMWDVTIYQWRSFLYH